VLQDGLAAQAQMEEVVVRVVTDVGQAVLPQRVEGRGTW